MNRRNSLWTGAAVMLASLCAASSFAQESGKSSSKVYREMRTMSRVLSEVLDRHDLIKGGHGFIGVSPFDAEIETSYIPTVGAIFQISVGFAIEEPESAPEEPAADPVDPNEDLWDKHSRSRGRGDRDDDKDEAPLPPRPPDGRETEFGPRPEQRDGRTPFPVAGDTRELPVVGRLYRGVSTDYDAAKVDRLRESVLETLGKYAYRMEHLGEDERILVIVDAPKDMTKYIKRMFERDPGGERDFGRSWSQDRPGPEGERDSRFGYPRDPQPMLFNMNDMRNWPWTRDHWLFSLRKGDATEAIEGKVIEEKVSEVRY